MEKKISIEGMSCGHCVNHVKEALSELDGVASIEVSLADKMAVIKADKEIKDEDIKFAIEDAGYEVVKVETR